jgi:hypothetical protein
MANEHAALVAAESQINRLQGRLARVASEKKSEISKVVNAAATGATAFGLGYVEERYPDRAQIGGMQLSTVIGGLAFVAGALGWTGEDELMLSIGTGALAVSAAKKGSEAGKEAKKKADQKK